MRIIILGDIVGTPGRQAVTQAIPVLREQYSPDLIIANAENASNGTGLTPDLYKKLVKAGVDAFTLGDHVYKKNHIIPTLQRESNIIRPANLSHKALGNRYMKLSVGSPEDNLPNIYVFTVLGRIFMSLPASDPFECCDQLIDDIKRHDPTAIIITEVHAEATSEKVALGWYLNGRVSCVFGTHTHTPTADARILPPTLGDGSISDHPSPSGGTAYITDLGMCGPTGSVLGRRVDRVLTYMTTNMPAPFDVATVSPVTSGIVLDLNPNTRLATSIERIELQADTQQPPFTAH
ncbi:YmdB family metallophosphoesterase [Planctomycetota bacterium]|nr:YmdB family metallophosphoesterase [Planctomycetota bacterium]